VIAQPADALRDRCIPGDHRAAASGRADHLGRIETEGGGNPGGAARLAVEAGAEPLRGVLDEHEPMALGKVERLGGVAHGAEEMDEQHRAGSRRHASGRLPQILMQS
jgi:hypothetical protein